MFVQDGFLYLIVVRHKLTVHMWVGTHSPGGEGVSIFRKTPGIGLASYTIIPLRIYGIGHVTCRREQVDMPGHTNDDLFGPHYTNKFRFYLYFEVTAEIAPRENKNMFPIADRNSE